VKAFESAAALDLTLLFAIPDPLAVRWLQLLEAALATALVEGLYREPLNALRKADQVNIRSDIAARGRSSREGRTSGGGRTCGGPPTAPPRRGRPRTAGGSRELFTCLTIAWWYFLRAKF
jgi:hypothetical protein